MSYLHSRKCIDIIREFGGLSTTVKVEDNTILDVLSKMNISEEQVIGEHNEEWEELMIDIGMTASNTQWKLNKEAKFVQKAIEQEEAEIKIAEASAPEIKKSPCLIPYGDKPNGDRHILLTGYAGTGKTYQIERFCEENPHLNILKVAPTGTAAVKCGGVTIHSLGVPVPCYGVKTSKTPVAKVKFLSVADVIIIDEISMVRNDVFSYFIKLIKRAEVIKGSRIRIIACGDFTQLPPVVPLNEAKNLKECGFEENGYPFTTKEWFELHFKVIELTEIHRQKNVEYKEMLNALKCNEFRAIDYFNGFYKETYQEKDDTVYLCGTNTKVKQINSEYLNNLPGEMYSLPSYKKGNTYKAGGYIEEQLLLKVGARVMFTVNDIEGLRKYGRQRFYNGTFGTVVAIFPEEKEWVNPDTGEIKTLKPNVKVKIGADIITVHQHEYEISDIKVDGKGEKVKLVNKKLGSIFQYPLKVAKAITIHKSQGQTYDNVVIEPEIFAAGMLYVALSRITDPSGLVLTKPISYDVVINDEIVEKFIDDGFTYHIKKKVPSTTKKTNTSAKTTKAAKSVKKTVKSAKKPVKKASTTANKKTTVKKSAKKTVSKK